jgi:hypothetical protein
VSAIIQLSSTPWLHDFWHRDNLYFPTSNDNDINKSECYVPVTFASVGLAPDANSDTMAYGKEGFTRLATILTELGAWKPFHSNISASFADREHLVEKLLEQNCGDVLPRLKTAI